MAFYDLNTSQRKEICAKIESDISSAIKLHTYNVILPYFENSDTYIRKLAYLAIGNAYKKQIVSLIDIMILLETLYNSSNTHTRQTTIYACGEIALFDFEAVKPLLIKAISDSHSSVRNAVIGSLKKSGEKNPKAIIPFCREHILSENPETRRLMCHGLELRGRAHPEEVIDILKLLQYEKVRKVKNMLIHVLGQISYKKGCLRYTAFQVKAWENPNIYPLYRNEVIKVHERYEKFSEFTQQEVTIFFEKI